MNAEVRSIDSIAKSFREALGILGGVAGVDLRRGRMETYLQTLQRAADGEPAEILDILTAVSESADVQQASRLRGEALQKVRHRLHEIAAGPLVADSVRDPGRDLLFELAVASRFQEVDPRVNLDSPSDVGFWFEGQRLLIECKRPTTPPAFRRRMVEGFRQMSSHRREGNGGFGALAVDLGLLVNPDNAVFQASTEAVAIDGLYGEVRRWFQITSDELGRVRRNVRVDAGIHLLIFRLQCLVGVATGRTSVATIWHAEPLIALDTPEFALIYRAVSRLTGFNREIQVLNPDDPRAAGLPRA